MEALLRFYYKEDEVPDRVVATSFAALFWVTSAAALIALPFAGQISEALLARPAAGLARISIGGLWRSPCSNTCSRYFDSRSAPARSF